MPGWGTATLGFCPKQTTYNKDLDVGNLCWKWSPESQGRGGEGRQGREGGPWRVCDWVVSIQLIKILGQSPHQISPLERVKVGIYTQTPILTDKGTWDTSSPGTLGSCLQGGHTPKMAEKRRWETQVSRCPFLVEDPGGCDLFLGHHSLIQSWKPQFSYLWNGAGVSVTDMAGRCEEEL
jgi:hypothetical protein